MTEKELFIEKMKKRTKQFTVDVICFCESLKIGKATALITYQIHNVNRCKLPCYM
jgi:hypothetical protein